jgi:hypothetical protein
MDINQQQMNNLSHRLPKIELSYETVFHNKVSSVYDICVSIPVGKRQFAWFSYDEDHDVCYLTDFTKDGKIRHISQLNVESNHSLSMNTIVYGTICDIDGLQFFVIDDIYYYKGICVKSQLFGEKMEYIKDIVLNNNLSEFKDIKSVVFKMAYMETITSDCDVESQNFYETTINKSAYASHHLQFRSTTHIMPYLNHTYKARIFTTQVIEPKIFIPRNDLDFGAYAYKSEAIFRVMADIQSDIYLLYAYDDMSEKQYEFVDIAYIGSRKDSVMMNTLFRNIRENTNVDYGEESEDEDMFQNTSADKYVDLKREYKMACTFHQKFKKWIPIKTVDAKSKCINISQLIRRNSTRPYENKQKPYENRNLKPYENRNPNINSQTPYVDRNPPKPYENRNSQKPYENKNYQKPYENKNYQKPYENRNSQKPYENKNYQKPYENKIQSIDIRPKPTFAYNRERKLC